MLLPRQNKTTYPAGYEPDISLAKWKTIFRDIGLGDDLITDLRTQPPDIILKHLFPAVTSPGKGVYLEYDLTQNSDLYVKILELISYYSNISYQGASLLAQAFEYGDKSRIDSTLDKNRIINKEYYVRELERIALTVKTALDYFGSVPGVPADLTSGIAGDLVAKGDSLVAKLLVFVSSSNEDDRVRRILSYSSKESVDEAFRASVKSSFVEASKANADYILNTGRKAASSFTEAVRRTAAEVIIRGYAKAPMSPTPVVDALLEELENPALLKDSGGKEETAILPPRKILTVRLYPAYAGIMLGNPTVAATQLSHNRFITTKLKETNIVVSINDIVALNTEDTQWLPFYAQLFTYIVNGGNPVFAIVAGRHRIERCSFAMVPKFNDSGASMQTFSVNVISSKTGLDFTEA